MTHFTLFSLLFFLLPVVFVSNCLCCVSSSLKLLCLGEILTLRQTFHRIWSCISSNWNAVNAWVHMHRHSPPSPPQHPSHTHTHWQTLIFLWTSDLISNLEPLRAPRLSLTTFSVFLSSVCSCCGELLAVKGGQRKQRKAVKKPLKEYFPCSPFVRPLLRLAAAPNHTNKCKWIWKLYRERERDPRLREELNGL